MTEHLRRKLAEVCTVRGCSATPCEDHNMCPAHRSAHNQTNRAYYQRRLGGRPVRGWQRRAAVIRCSP